MKPPDELGEWMYQEIVGFVQRNPFANYDLFLLILGDGECWLHGDVKGALKFSGFWVEEDKHALS